MQNDENPLTHILLRAHCVKTLLGELVLASDLEKPT
jgi:hypothetical protein